MSHIIFEVSRWFGGASRVTGWRWVERHWKGEARRDGVRWWVIVGGGR